MIKLRKELIVFNPTLKHVNLRYYNKQNINHVTSAIQAISC